MTAKWNFVPLWISMLTLAHPPPTAAWFLDTPTNPPTESYPIGEPSRDFDSVRQPGGWNSPGSSSFDHFQRPQPPPVVDHLSPSHGIDHGSDGGSSPGGFGYRPDVSQTHHGSFNPDRQPALDTFGSHSSSFGHDRQPPSASDSFGGHRGFYESRPSPNYPSNPFDRIDSTPSHRGFNDREPSQANPPPPFGPYGAPSIDPSGPIRDCKCVCNSEAIRTEGFSMLHNWVREVQSNPHDVVCMSTSLPGEGSASHALGPMMLPFGRTGYYWTHSEQEGATAAVSTEPPFPKIDINNFVDNRKNEMTTATTTCAHDVTTASPPDPVEPPEPSEPIPEPYVPESKPDPVPEPEITARPTEGYLKQERELKSGEMSESAVAGLVCGIFAVVVLIVVVVVSRKVIVASAEQKAKRKSEEESVPDPYDDPNYYSKTSSSTGYPPRYL